ncbi:MAG TPA: metal ABC transporter substrate-binding protein [Actinomycetota bacterium]|nr:metal ABC transporter substrate-binding protein [Actinomycetota bacterium]
MRMRLMGAAVAAALLAACSFGLGERVIVATVYPVAYAAERIAGPEWDVIDLTAGAAEAHDLELSLEQRAAIEGADVVFYYGDLGFQPHVEEAVRDAQGTVVAINGPNAADAQADPHLWLWPNLYLSRIADHVQIAMWDIDEARAEEYERRARTLFRDLERLQRRYDDVLGGPCEYRTAIVSHEAFGYLLERRYEFRQFGLAGLSPEGEPTSGRIEGAQELIEDRKAGAVFYEPTDEARRVAERVADDGGVPALPLSPLETRPAEGDYLSVMEDNLRSLRRGLSCR